MAEQESVSAHNRNWEHGRLGFTSMPMSEHDLISEHEDFVFGHNPVDIVCVPLTVERKENKALLLFDDVEKLNEISCRN